MLVIRVISVMLVFSKTELSPLKLQHTGYIHLRIIKCIKYGWSFLV